MPDDVSKHSTLKNAENTHLLHVETQMIYVQGVQNGLRNIFIDLLALCFQTFQSPILFIY